MRFHIITLFPETIEPYVSSSILGKAQEAKKIEIKMYNPRDFLKGKERADDIPYGGGPGMVMKAEPILKAWKKARGTSKKRTYKTIFFTPGGKTFTTKQARNYTANYTDIICICGRYEGIDERVQKITKAEKISIGDFILTGGELPALIIIDTVSRLIPGVLGKQESVESERIASHAIYTRPHHIEWKGKKYSVPKVLMSGDHKKIDEWRSNN